MWFDNFYLFWTFSILNDWVLFLPLTWRLQGRLSRFSHLLLLVMLCLWRKWLLWVWNTVFYLIRCLRKTCDQRPRLFKSRGFWRIWRSQYLLVLVLFKYICFLCFHRTTLPFVSLNVWFLLNFRRFRLFLLFFNCWLSLNCCLFLFSNNLFNFNNFFIFGP